MPQGESNSRLRVCLYIPCNSSSTHFHSLSRPLRSPFLGTSSTRYLTSFSLAVSSTVHSRHDIKSTTRLTFLHTPNDHSTPTLMSVMMKSSIVTSLIALLPFASAHFRLVYPAARGLDEVTLGNFPCGGQKVSANRTVWPIKGGPIQLQMGHTMSAVEVLLGLGNDVGSSFNITLVPIFQEQGLGQFCMSSVAVPGDLKVTEGQNATIQVITNGDPSGGLYNVWLRRPALYSTNPSLTCPAFSAPISHSPPAPRALPSARTAPG